ncbi:MAG: glycosyltransferase family 2 protein [Actinomycetota bacterium]
MNQELPRIAVIVPALNEESRIGAVLEVLTNVALIEEVIVVDDGSTDRTSEVARKYGAKVLRHEINGGKGAAMQTGIEATDADIIAFIDADLVGLKQKHIEDLLNPLINSNDIMMTVGKFEGGRLRTDLAQKIVPFISGQRALKRDFLYGLADLRNTGFGVEIAITQHAKNNGFKVKEVIFDEAGQVMKEEKLGIIKGFKFRMKMYFDMLKQSIRGRAIKNAKTP